jgi:hypothetical protein
MGQFNQYVNWAAGELAGFPEEADNIIFSFALRLSLETI